MRLSRRAFLAVAASTMLAACGGGKKETEEAEVVEEPAEVEPVVTELTNYAVYRCDYKRGIMGDFEAITENTQDFSAFYATITPEGNLSFDINGLQWDSRAWQADEDAVQRYRGLRSYPAPD